MTNWIYEGYVDLWYGVYGLDDDDDEDDDWGAWRAEEKKTRLLFCDYLVATTSFFFPNLLILPS